MKQPGLNVLKRKFLKITKIINFAIKFLIQDYESKRSRNLTLHPLTFPRGKNYSWFDVCIFNSIPPCTHPHISQICPVYFSLYIYIHTSCILFCSLFLFLLKISLKILGGCDLQLYFILHTDLREFHGTERYSSPLNNTGALT